MQKKKILTQLKTISISLVIYNLLRLKIKRNLLKINKKSSKFSNELIWLRSIEGTQWACYENLGGKNNLKTTLKQNLHNVRTSNLARQI